MEIALSTDLYELTMAQSYLEHGKKGKAVFSLFVRKLPPNRNFLISCGLETLMEHLDNFVFDKESLLYLKSLGIFKDFFLDYLEEYRVKANIYAVPEGRIVFENEPIVQIEGELPDVQILETVVINVIHFQTVIASKAVRSFLVSEGRTLVDFGLRRAHTLEAGLFAARASYIGGFDGTSNLEAGRRFGIPVYGTVAHSYIMIFDKEEEAFKAFAKSFPERAIHLIDTYDTLKAIDKVIRLVKEGMPAVGVRIDSGNIPYLTKEVRRRLKEAGLEHIKIIVSGGVDEYKIEEWLKEGAEIDAFGVGTKFITSADHPYLDMAYKLVEYEGKPKYKTSPGKATFPYKRQIFRTYNENGKMDKDFVVIYGKDHEGEKLVEEITKDGSSVYKFPSLKEIRDRAMDEIERLPDPLRELKKAYYEVIIE